MTAKEVAERWHVSENTLAHWRRNETGPEYIRYGKKAGGRIRYLKKAIENYEESHTVKPKSN